MKYVYSFKEGNKDLRDTLGGKGANLAEMTNLGLPVPSGFTISTDACLNFFEENESISRNIEMEILNKLIELEKASGKRFGNKDNPLLLSVRSGSPISMPGMMDSVLNIGMSEETLEGLKKKNPRSALDCYRRLIQMYAEVVKSYPKEKFSDYINEYKTIKGYETDLELTENDLIIIIDKFKENYLECGGEYFPDSPRVQLMEAIKAVFKSWNNERARTYRKVNGIDDKLGTAVNVQEMVYGNFNDKSASGVLFSRNTISGSGEMIGEYLINAQGEDVVSGARTPKKIDELKTEIPGAYNDLLRISKEMEKHFLDVQDMEFTIENEKLFILQTRNAKRTPLANIRFALSFLDEGLIDEEEALLKIDSEDLEAIIKPVFDDEALKKAKVIAKGLAASFACASGTLKLDINNTDKETILVREETSPEDINGMLTSSGILTKRGGLSSHAAVISRGFGIAAICGCETLEIDEKNACVKFGDVIIKEGEHISIDGRTGLVYEGNLPLKDNYENKSLYDRVLTLIEKYETLPVKANADTGDAAILAKKYGAKGIGLVRTEHMFFSEERLVHIRKLILSSNYHERKEALEKLEEFQTNDFYEILKATSPNEVIVRYLDPPLHEFLPKKPEEIKKLAETINMKEEDIHKRVIELSETNPMMGLRGARLLIKLPDIIKMQTNAIIKSVKKLLKENITPDVGIMIPLISDVREFIFIKEIIDNQIKKEFDSDIKIKVGTMIETPRAALISDELSKYADFYSFGTNDLTQLTFGLSRDDAGDIVSIYSEKNIFVSDPFKELDINYVGKLIEFTKTNATRNISMGICGEQAGSEEAIYFARRIGLNYVSVSPSRIIGARLASAKAEVKYGTKKDEESI